MAKHKILFLTLRVFSATGGIEKICRIACRALGELKDEGILHSLKVFSMYDAPAETDSRYAASSFFSGFSNNKLVFVVRSVITGLKSNTIILSHINLLSVGYISKLLSFRSKLILYAHGIEVWGPLSKRRVKMLHKCDRILAVSQYTKDKMVEQYQLPPEKITVLNNCLDPYLPPPIVTGKDEVLMSKYGFTKSNHILMTLTRLSSKELYKGYDHVLLSVNTLKEKYKDLKYLIVGRYDDAEKKRLDAIIHQHNLQQHVIFTGYVPDEDLARHYSLADVYVMPSKKEGFGIVFIEAMYYGLPVIAGNKDGSADALFNGELGMLVNPDNQLEINNAIEKMLLHKEQYKPDQNKLEQLFSYNSYKENFKKLFN